MSIHRESRINKMGVFKPGWGRNAEGQQKKHVDQMNLPEKEFLTYLLKDMKDSFKIHPHLQEKQQKNLLSFDILTIRRTLGSRSLMKFIREYSVIEKGDGFVDRRVLIRSPKREKVYIKNVGRVWCNLVFVVSLDTSQIITAYYSHQNHKYETNEERYTKNLQIV